MGVSMAAFTTFIEQFSDVLWNSLLLFLLVGTGIYFTVRLRGVQVRRFGEGFRRVFGGFTLRGKKADAEGMSSSRSTTAAKPCRNALPNPSRSPNKVSAAPRQKNTADIHAIALTRGPAYLH